MYIPHVLGLPEAGRELGLRGAGLCGTGRGVSLWGAGRGAGPSLGRGAGQVFLLPKVGRDLEFPPLLVPLVNGENVAYTWREFRFKCGLVTTSSSPC